jgi:hypothetical protein
VIVGKEAAVKLLLRLSLESVFIDEANSSNILINVEVVEKT